MQANLTMQLLNGFFLEAFNNVPLFYLFILAIGATFCPNGNVQIICISLKTWQIKKPSSHYSLSEGHKSQSFYMEKILKSLYYG